MSEAPKIKYDVIFKEPTLLHKKQDADYEWERAVSELYALEARLERARDDARNARFAAEAAHREYMASITEFILTEGEN